MVMKSLWLVAATHAAPRQYKEHFVTSQAVKMLGGIISKSAMSAAATSGQKIRARRLVSRAATLSHISGSAMSAATKQDIATRIRTYATLVYSTITPTGLT